MTTASRLRRGLESLGEIAADSTQDTAKELSLWDGALAEVIRQVAIHCQERGQLLEAIRSRHAQVFDHLLTQRQADLDQVRHP